MSIRQLAALASLAGCSLLAGNGYATDGIAWSHRSGQGAVTLTANPLSGISRSAFYEARGFPAKAIRPYAQACGFSFGMQNNGTATLTTRLADWQAVGRDGRRVALRLPESWDAGFEKAGVPQAARIAFRWAQFQAENTFEPGDWIMGMATLEQPLPGMFRLVARYRDDRGNHEIVLDGLACAHD